MLVYTKNAFPIAVIKDMDITISLKFDDIDFIMYVLKNILEIIRNNKKVLEIYSPIKKNLQVLRFVELEKLTSLCLPYSYVFYLDNGYSVNINQLHYFITDVGKDTIKIKESEYKITGMDVVISPISYIVEMLDWHIPVDKFYPITKKYEDTIINVGKGFLRLQMKKSTTCKGLISGINSVSDAVIRYITLKNFRPHRMYMNTPYSIVKSINYKLYEILVDNKPYTLLLTMDVDLPEFKNIGMLKDFLLKNVDLLDSNLFKTLMKIPKNGWKFKVVKLVDTVDYDIIKKYVAKKVKEGFLPFMFNIDYTELPKHIIIKNGEYINLEEIEPIKETISLYEKIKGGNHEQHISNT